MILTINELTKDIKNADLQNVLSCWLWKIRAMKAVVAMTVLGDLFFIGKDDHIYLLQTDTGELDLVTETIDEFYDSLNDAEKVDEWFLPLLIESLVAEGKLLGDNEVYSYKLPPVIGGEYSVANIEPTDMYVHFGFTGQVCQQVSTISVEEKVSITVES